MMEVGYWQLLRRRYVFVWTLLLIPPATVSAQTLRFDFGPGKVEKGYVAVQCGDLYNNQRNFGFASNKALHGNDRGIRNSLRSDFITSDQPFYFATDLPEGNYRVTITFGDAVASSSTTVKAESRRLMLENVVTRSGEFITKSFLVNVRTPGIGDDDSIRLKPREVNYLNWDNKLTLEFTGKKPVINAVTISREEKPLVIFLAGNSTVVDQEYEPWASWGQMIPAFFSSDVVIANYAESGESLLSFEREQRKKKIITLIKPGDYVFIEFAHNDQKPGGNHLDAFTTYKEALNKFINEVRGKGGIPVLVTSMHRRRFDESGKIINTLENYPEAVRQTSREKNVPLVDLNAMSKILYEALGEEGSKHAFVHYAANTFPGQDKPLEDNTHFNNYGAYQLARCVVEEIKDNMPELAKYLSDDVIPYAPDKPDSFDSWEFPESVSFEGLKPDGN